MTYQQIPDNSPGVIAILVNVLRLYFLIFFLFKRMKGSLPIVRLFRVISEAPGLILTELSLVVNGIGNNLGFSFYPRR